MAAAAILLAAAVPLVVHRWLEFSSGSSAARLENHAGPDDPEET